MERTKVYMFYGTEADLYPGRRDSETLHLYGFTNDKAIAKRFKKMRKMKIFTKRTVYMTEKEYSDFCRNSRESLIEMSPIDTMTESPNKEESIARQAKTIDLPLTFLEFQTIKDYQENFMQSDWFDHSPRDDGAPYKWIPYGIFTEDVIRALLILEYPQMMQLFIAGGDGPFYGDNEYGVVFPYSFQQSIDLTHSEYDMPNIWFDELAVLYRVYGHTLNEKIFVG